MYLLVKIKVEKKLKLAKFLVFKKNLTQNPRAEQRNICAVSFFIVFLFALK